MQFSKSITIVLKWGGYFALALALFDLLKLFTRDINYTFAPIFSILLLVIIIAMLLLGTKECRENVFDGSIRYFKAYGIGAMITIVAVILYFAFLLIYYQRIDENGVERINKKNEDIYAEKLKSDTLTTKELENYNLLVKEKLNTSVEKKCKTNCEVDSSYFKEFTELIFDNYEQQLITEKLNLDSTNFLFKNFNMFAIEKLRNARNQSLSDAQDTSIQFRKMVLLLTSEVEDTLSQYDPFYERLEAERANIPHYKSKVQVAFISTFLILVYALFVNIFTALYIYRNKQSKIFGHTNQ